MPEPLPCCFSMEVTMNLLNPVVRHQSLGVSWSEGLSTSEGWEQSKSSLWRGVIILLCPCTIGLETYHRLRVSHNAVLVGCLHWAFIYAGPTHAYTGGQYVSHMLLPGQLSTACCTLYRAACHCHVRMVFRGILWVQADFSHKAELLFS